MYDDNEERLRDLMLAVDVPPTGADIARAKATGRKHLRRNRIALGAAAAALLTVSGTAYVGWRAGPEVPPGHGQPGPVVGCAVEVVDVPAGNRGRANAVDPTGRTIVGTIYDNQWRGHAVRFENGRAVAIPGATGNMVAVNAGGLLVGYDDVDNASHTLGWTYQDGQKTLLAKLSGYEYTLPKAVNARGDVVGVAMGDALDETAPVVWPADRPGTVRKLAVSNGFGDPGTTDSRAIGIADDGTVVGSAYGEPIRWAPDGAPSALPVLAGYRNASPTALRGHYVYGWASFNAENRNVAVRWDLDSGVMKVLEGAPDDVIDGTPDGWSLTTGVNTGGPVRISPGGYLEKLPQPPNPSPAKVIAQSISDDGATVAGATSSDNPVPVIWHC